MEHLLRIAEDFYACTHLITRAFDRFGRCLGVATGDKQTLSCQPSWRKAIFAALDELSAQPQLGHVLRGISEGQETSIWFVVCYADPAVPELGAFGFGPFVSQEGLGYPVKPLPAVPHLVELLTSLARDAMLPWAGRSQWPGGPLRQALEAIHRAFPAQIALEEVCREAGISKPGLCRAFRREMGTTFCGYVHRLRVERGKLLLDDPSYSMLDVALTAGFADQSYFNRIFKRETGQTPRSYRAALWRAKRKDAKPAGLG